MSPFYAINCSKTIHLFAYITAYATPSIEVDSKIPIDLNKGKLLSSDTVFALSSAIFNAFSTFNKHCSVLFLS